MLSLTTDYWLLATAPSRCHVRFRLVVRQRIEPHCLQEGFHPIDRRRLQRRGRRRLGGGQRSGKSVRRDFLLQRQRVQAGKIEKCLCRQVAARFRQLDDGSVDLLQVTPDLQLGALYGLLSRFQGGKGCCMAAAFLGRVGRGPRLEVLLRGAALLHGQTLTVGYGAPRCWRWLLTGWRRAVLEWHVRSPKGGG